MRLHTLIAVLALVACAPDDQAFDVSALTPEHQAQFRQAAVDLNIAHPDRADFTFPAEDARSRADYRHPHPWVGRGATKEPLLHNQQGWHISFDPMLVPFLQPATLYQISRHELCHVIGFDHGAANPPGGSC